MAKSVKRKTNIQKLLEELEKEELIAEIEKLCTKFEVVRTYFEVELSGDASKQLEKAKKAIDKQLYTSAGSPKNPKASRMNNIVRDFEQISIYKEDVIQLLLYRIEETINFGDDFGINDALYQSTQRAISKVTELVRNEGLEEKYKDRLRSLPYIE